MLQTLTLFLMKKINHEVQTRNDPKFRITNNKKLKLFK